MSRMIAALLAIAGWASYVTLASYLGMTGGDPTAIGAPAWENMQRMWRESAVADAAFVAGLVIVSALAWRIARAGRPWTSAATGFFGAWLTFAAAFAIQSAQKGSDVFSLAGGGFLMVLLAGWMGLAFAAMAPVAAAQARTFK